MAANLRRVRIDYEAALRDGVLTCNQVRLMAAHIRDGEYRFDAVGSGPFRALIDGQPLFAVDDVVPEQPAEKSATRTLTPGLHPIEVTFESPKLAQTTRRIFQLSWTPPGGQRQLIPPTNLVPAGH